LVKICSACGAKYPEEYNHCIRCPSDGSLVYFVKTPKIKDIKTNPNNHYNFNEYPNKFSEVKDLLSQPNIDKLTDFNLSQLQFNEIITNIKKTSEKILNELIDKHHINFYSISTLDKIMLFSKSFVKTDYKEGGGNLGHFEFNEIYIDDRASDAIQITTLIHELSHFLLSEILEQVVSEILKTEKTEAVEAFVCYALINNELNYLVDEYCAHTVEGRFALLGYQDYGSYKHRLSEFLQYYSEDHVEVANGIGNTFADYIKSIIEPYIDENLRMDIKKEFSKINDMPKYSELKYETSEVFDWQRFSKSMQLMLTSNLEEFINNPQDMEKLMLYSVKFKKNNQYNYCEY